MATYDLLIILEIIVTIGIIVGYLKEEKVVKWEHRKLKQFKKAVMKMKRRAKKQKSGIIEQLKRTVREIKRDLCAKWLAEDGMIAIPRLAENEDIITLHK